MSKKKEYKEISTYDMYTINIKPIMKTKGISQNILAKMTRLSINTIRAYYHSNIERPCTKVHGVILSTEST